MAAADLRRPVAAAAPGGASKGGDAAQQPVAAAAPAGSAPRWLGCRCCGLACRVSPATDVDAARANAARTAAGAPARAVADLPSPAIAAATSTDDDARLRCPRCGEPLPQREAMAAQRTWALLLASLAAYVPANLMPIMSTTTALQPTSHTILGGIAELWTSGAWVLAVIVFVASVAVPMLKIGALALLAWSEQHAPHWRRPERAKLYRLVDAVGHWSMLDVYVVVLLTAMVHFGRLANVSPEPGLLAFAGMVVLTLLAAHSVDPLQIWAEPNGDGADTAASADAADAADAADRAATVAPSPLRRSWPALASTARAASAGSASR